MTIALCAIVKDELPRLPRLFESCKDIIDSWLIFDTGSTDGTQDYLMSLDMPGELHLSEWRDFGTNRSELMAKAQGVADYLLLLDADMEIRQHGELPVLSADSYLLQHEGGVTYYIPRLVTGSRLWYYVGVTHEYLHSDGPAASREKLSALTVVHHHDGSSWGVKFERDKVLLTQAFADDPTNARTVFYLAQTYRDLLDYDNARYYYNLRADMGQWMEEAFVARLEAAKLTPDNEKPACLLHAWSMRPTRAEPLYELVKLYAVKGDMARMAAYNEARKAIKRPEEDILFVDERAYQ